jgi:hypothetical protein
MCVWVCNSREVTLFDSLQSRYHQWRQVLCGPESPVAQTEAEDAHEGVYHCHPVTIWCGLCSF